MKAVLCLSAALLGCAAPALAQRTSSGAAEVEAVVTVTAVDREKRTVTIRGPQGNLATLAVPKEAKNFDRVKPGARFKMRYSESAAISIDKGGAGASASVDKKVQAAAKGANPGGTVTETVRARVVVEALDYTNRIAALRGPEGSFSVKVPPEVNIGPVSVGDRVNIVYTRALALEMIPQEKKP